MKCLEKRPDRRYADGSELAEDLQRFLAGWPVKARPVSGWVRMGKWVRRRPALAALSAVVTLAILGAIVGLAWTGAREREHNAKLLGALDQTRASEQRAHRLWASGQIRLAQFYHDLGNVETASEILEDVRPGVRSAGPAWLRVVVSRSALPEPASPVAQAFLRGFHICAIAANGRMVALDDNQGGIRVWDVVTGTIKPLKGRIDGPILALEFSPDGRTLASSSFYSTKLWDMDTGELWPCWSVERRTSGLAPFRPIW